MDKYIYDDKNGLWYELQEMCIRDRMYTVEGFRSMCAA